MIIPADSPVVSWKDDQAVLPLLLAAAGILASIMGTFIVRAGEQADFGQLLWALRRGIFAAGTLSLLGSFGVIYYLFQIESDTALGMTSVWQMWGFMSSPR